MRKIFLLLIVMFLFALSSFAYEGSITLSEEGSKFQAFPLSDDLEVKISLDLRDIDIVDALQYLAMKAGINVIPTKKVSGRVTFMVENVNFKDIFDIMLRSNGLAYVKQGDIYNVMTEEEYKSLYGEKFSDSRQIKTFRLKYAIPDQAFVLLDTLKSDIGRVLVEPDSGVVLIMDTPSKIREIEDALSILEERNPVEIFDLKYAEAKDVEEQLKAQLEVRRVGTVKADERSNQVIVQALPDRMADMRALIESLDKKTKQVMIDTKIVKVKLSDQLTSGVEWEGLVNAGKKFGMTYFGSYPFSSLQPLTDDWQSREEVANNVMNGSIGSYPFSGTTGDYASGSKVKPGQIHVGVIDKNRDFDILMKYLQTLGNTQILSNPKLSALNNREARIHVGERQAYVTSTTTTGQTTTTVSEEVTFVDIGIQLSVTPTINSEGYIRMNIKPEISSVISTLITNQGNQIPIIDTSMAETTVMVKDGSTIVIGGLRKEEKSSASEEVPILSKIPILGFFFKLGTKKTERTELLVMLTPHIVTGDSLITGDERDFVHVPYKGYKGYDSLTVEKDLLDLREKEIKTYRGYINLEKQNPKP